MGYAFVVEYKKGSDNKVVDALSRQSEFQSELSQLSGSPKTCCLFLLSVPNPTWLDLLKDSYSQDVSIQQIIHSIQDGASPKGFTYQNGILFYKGRFYLGPLCSLKT